MQKALIIGNTGFLGRHFVAKAKSIMDLTNINSKNCDLLTDKIYEYDNEKYDSNNGLLLCPNIHTLFDKQDLKFIKKENNEYIIKINDKYNDDETLKIINGKTILFSNEEIHYLENRYNKK